VQVNKASGKKHDAIADTLTTAMRAAERRRELMAQVTAATDELRQAVSALHRAGLAPESIATLTGLSLRQVQHFTAE
jgi:DNA-directed RNA polymerase specialized sigma24 family protein